RLVGAVAFEAVLPEDGGGLVARGFYRGRRRRRGSVGRSSGNGTTLRRDDRGEAEHRAESDRKAPHVPPAAGATDSFETRNRLSPLGRTEASRKAGRARWPAGGAPSRRAA